MISEVPEFSSDVLKKELPELPWAKRERMKREYELKDVDADLFIDSDLLAGYFEKVSAILKDKKLSKLALNYLISDYTSLLKKGVKETAGKEGTNADENGGDPFVNIEKVPVDSFAELMRMINENLLSSRGAKDTLKIMFEKGGSPREISKSEGFIQTHDEGALEKIVSDVIAANPKVVDEYKSGKVAVLQFLIGQGMKASKGSANPAILTKIFNKLL